MTQPYRFFIGIDWAWKEHTVCIIDANGKELDQTTIAHSGVGLAQLHKLLGKLEGAPESVAVAIETPRGAIVESLLERKFPVFSLNPKQMDRFRDRHTIAGAKDDRRDAFVQADSLRTDQSLFRKLDPDEESHFATARVDANRGRSSAGSGAHPKPPGPFAESLFSAVAGTLAGGR